MERKDYKPEGLERNFKLEIVGELLRGPNHARAIAKKLGTNHVLVTRRLRELQNDNAADYREEGKNKAYFLKKSLEAKSLVLMYESHSLSRMLKKYPALRAITEKIQKDAKIRLAVLFGSYAKGLAKPDSDIDVFIETVDREVKQRIADTSTKLSVKIGSFDLSSPLVKEIVKNHVILKGVEVFYEKTGFFG